MFPKERSIIFYRRCQRTPKKELDAAQIYLKWCYEMILVGKDYFPVKKVNIPEMADGTTVEEMAETLRRYWYLGNSPVRNLESLLEEQGFFIFTAHLPNKKIDGYSQLIGNIPIIIINRNKGNYMRQRFSMAHELGHIVLHNRIKDCNERDLGDIEKEADQFAGCFLMPEKEIKAELIRTDVDYIIDIAKKWGVSPHAVVERCYKISAFSNDPKENDARAKSLFQKLNQIKLPGMNEGLELCSIRKRLIDIGSSAEMGMEFLQKLRFPAEEVRRLCSLPDNCFDYDKWELQENPDDMEGVQLSFVFD